MSQDKDLDTFHWYKLDCLDTQSSQSTQDDNLEVHQCMLTNMNTKVIRWSHGIERMVHMEMGYMDLDKDLVVEVWLELIENKTVDKINDNEPQSRENLTWLRVTSWEWIPCITIHAITNWTMIIDSTLGIWSAGVWTRVNTLLVCARFVVGAFRADNTFRSTAWWTSRICWETWTHCLVINFFALRVGTAWRWLTRVHILWNDRWCRKGKW